MNQLTEKEQLLTIDARELADAARSAWQAWSAWIEARNQLNRLFDEAYTKHRAGMPGELGLGPFMFESIASNLDAGNVQYLLRAIERKRAIDTGLALPHVQASMDDLLG